VSSDPGVAHHEYDGTSTVLVLEAVAVSAFVMNFWYKFGSISLQEDSSGRGAGRWGVRRPLVAVLGPARRRIDKLSGAGDFVELDSGVVPVETFEVVASGSECHVRDGSTVAILIGILAMNHPVATSLRLLESLVLRVGIFARAVD